VPEFSKLSKLENKYRSITSYLSSVRFRKQKSQKTNLQIHRSSFQKLHKKDKHEYTSSLFHDSGPSDDGTTSSDETPSRSVTVCSSRIRLRFALECFDLETLDSLLLLFGSISSSLLLRPSTSFFPVFLVSERLKRTGFEIGGYGSETAC